ncbi:hypothetical protein [Sphingobacterium sp. LRF_L2]|uniref:hypothetical protein n=1 Tax=Sphingobacterium sp. LRF_L2 TaxID=3369421 RepID=UPI003F606D5B
MENVYIKNPQFESEPQCYLLEGGIYQAFECESFDSFRERLWKLFMALTSRSQTTDEEQRQLQITLDKLILMVKGCHYFLHHKKRLNYEEEWIDVKWLKNPYRCLKKYRHRDDEKLNHHLAHFDYGFTQLSRAEVQNFTEAFKSFFSLMDLSSWLNLFDDYKQCLFENESLFEWSVDDTPLKTYAQLLKLIEACIIAVHWADIDYPPPNAHLYLSFFNMTYESYRDANPIEMCSMLFFDVSYDELRRDILELYAGCHEPQQGFTMKPNDLRFNLRWLIQTGWLLLQTNYFPEDWLSPDRFNWLICPIPESEIKYWRPKNLSVKQREKLAKTLSKVYFDVEVHDLLCAVENRLICYMNEKDRACLDIENLKTRDRLLKILDVVTVILIDFCQRRTRTDGIKYPKGIPAQEIVDNQKVENKTKNR